MRLIRNILLVLAGIFALASPAAAERKLALVIGNDTYSHVTPLERAVADARAYREALSTQRGFEVVYAENADRTTMVTKIGEFLSRLRADDVAMVVYSGHGVQLDPNRGDTLYLLPTDIPTVDPGSGGAEFFLDAQAINFARLSEQVAVRGAKLRVYVIDACRNNPFPAASGGRSIGLTRGLGRLGANNGEFVFFAAAPGEVALDLLPNDDDTENSVFTRVFLKHFRPGTYLEDIANEVQAEVLELSRQASITQRPYYSDGVAGKACLDTECGTASPASGGNELEATYWRLCETRDTLSYCKAYLKSFPGGPHAPLAQMRIDEMEGFIVAGTTASGQRVVTIGPASSTAAEPGPEPAAIPAVIPEPLPAATPTATREPVPMPAAAPVPDPEPEPRVATVEPAATISTYEAQRLETDADLARQREAYLAWTRLEGSWDIRAVRDFRARYPEAEQTPEADRRIAFLRERHREAQTELNRLGYKAGAVDGDWGRRSAKALRAFQRDHGLERNGTVDQKILYALKTATRRAAASATTPAATRAAEPAPEPETQPVAQQDPAPQTKPDPAEADVVEPAKEKAKSAALCAWLQSIDDTNQGARPGCKE